MENGPASERIRIEISHFATVSTINQLPLLIDISNIVCALSLIFFSSQQFLFANRIGVSVKLGPDSSASSWCRFDLSTLTFIRFHFSFRSYRKWAYIKMCVCVLGLFSLTNGNFVVGFHKLNAKMRFTWSFECVHINWPYRFHGPKTPVSLFYWNFNSLNMTWGGCGMISR